MQIKTWDIVTRLFHWALALSVTMAFVSIKMLGDIELHMRCGAVVMGLLVFRLCWGFVGSSTARFRNFITGFTGVLHYIRQPSSVKAQTIGHSPLAGWAVLAMILVLCVQVMTGLYSDDEIYSTGPLAGTVSSSFSALATKIHYQTSDIVMFTIAMHLIANGYYAFVLKINLVKPMITGKKKASFGNDVKERPVIAIGCAILSILLVVSIFYG